MFFGATHTQDQGKKEKRNQGISGEMGIMRGREMIVDGKRGRLIQQVTRGPRLWGEDSGIKLSIGGNCEGAWIY